jgi:general secretion pathway protein I
MSDKPLHQEAGFTLLEVVVAVAIASLALVVLFQAGAGGLFASDTASRAEEAVARAQSHLAAVGRDAGLVAGEFSGDDGGGFRWRLRVRPDETRPGEGVLTGVTLYDVEVTVSWPSRGRDRSVSLRTFRLGGAVPGG